jgi:hypothetical protein
MAAQKIDQLVADEWKTFTFSDIFEINDRSYNCPIESYKLCGDAECLTEKVPD